MQRHPNETQREHVCSYYSEPGTVCAALHVCHTFCVFIKTREQSRVQCVCAYVCVRYDTFSIHRSVGRWEMKEMRESFSQSRNDKHLVSKTLFISTESRLIRLTPQNQQTTVHDTNSASDVTKLSVQSSRKAFRFTMYLKFIKFICFMS